MDVPTRITKLREEKGISKNNLAKISGVAQSFISAIEAGQKQPTVDTLDRITKALDISLAEFFSDTQNTSLDPDQFSVDPRNRELIKAIKGLQAAGYSNEVIQEWIDTLHRSLTELAKKYGVIPGQPQGKIVFAADDITPKEQKILDKLREKLKDPNFKPPWE